MSQRLTGNAATPATASATAMLAQKCSDSTVASMAPGMASMIALSTTSMIVIDAASAARATRSATDHGYRPWLDRIDHVVETSHGARWLARGGVLAFQADGCLGFKGGWIRDGEHRLDKDKDARSDQLRCYGFS